MVPVIALPRRPLSNSASTDSCSIRFSLRTIISGAFRSSKRPNRLFRLITRRYKSFKSDVANRPPSNGTNGRNSGGNTGNTVIIIHSGRLFDATNDSITLRRLENFLIFVSEFVELISSRRIFISSFKSIDFNKSKMASAPILASNSSPCSSTVSRYSSSVSS